MFRINFVYSLIASLILLSSLGFSAQAELNGNWRDPIVTPLTDPLEIRAANKETYVDPNNTIVPVAVLGTNPGGGTQLGVYDIFHYLNTPIPALPPQNDVDAAFHPLNLGTSNIFGIDGIVGNTDGINMIAACVDDLLQIIKIDGVNLTDVQQISDSQCNEASISGVPGIPDRFYASQYDANAQVIDVLLSEDGGDSWNPFYQITQNFGGIPVGAANGGVRHDIIGFNTVNDPDASIIRSGLCVNYTEAGDNGPGGLVYGVKCLEVVNNNPNNFYTQVFDTGFFPVPKISESRARRGPRPLVAAAYPGFENDTEAPVWRLTKVEGLGSPQPNNTNPIDISQATGDLPVVTGNLMAIGTEDQSDPWYFAQENDQRVIKADTGIVTIPNIGNYPCNQNTENIVAPIGLGGTLINNEYRTIIACPGGSLLLSELIQSGPAVVPTLNEWGLIALSGLILFFSAFVLRRRAQTSNN